MKFAGVFAIISGFLIMSVVGCKKEPIDGVCDHIITDTIYDTIFVDPNIPGPITYNDHVASIMNNNCITCHSGSGPSGGFGLATYTEVLNAAQNRPLVERINDADNPMPQSGIMNQGNRSLIERWINDGHLEN